MKRWLLLGFALPLLAGDPQLFYSRAFPGSTPDYIQVTVQKNGDGVYQEAVDDELPLKFKLNADETQEVFGLAEKLGYFNHPLESQLKVAFMGTKTFRYENGDQKAPQKGEVKFNYSEDQSAQQLVDWFERMAESAEHRIELERTAKYDRLGVVQALTGLEAAMENGRVVAPEQFLPTLDRIVNNDNYMHTARARAAEIAEYIRGVKK